MGSRTALTLRLIDTQVSYLSLEAAKDIKIPTILKDSKHDAKSEL